MKRVLKLMTLLVSVLAIGVLTGDRAFAAWTTTSTQNVNDTITATFTGLSDLKDLKETSSFVASKTYPGWYYTASDRAKVTGDTIPDSYTACAGLSGTALDNCRKEQRAKIWMVHIQGTVGASNYRKIDQVRSFPMSSSAWALSANIGLNGDWEDMTQGPVRTVGGVTSNTILIGATGKDTGNGNCNSRRIIEFNEMNPNAAPGTTWSPTYIYDLNGSTIAADQSDCNIEAIWLDFDGTTPYAYMATYGSVNGTFLTHNNVVFRRVLTTTTGRAASTGFNGGTPITPSSSEFQRVGYMSATKAYQISGAAFQESNDDMAMISSNSSVGGGCQLLMWHSRSYVTTTNPNEYTVCTSGVTDVVAEGISYVYSTDPTVKSVHVLYDETNENTIYHKYFYWE